MFKLPFNNVFVSNVRDFEKYGGSLPKVITVFDFDRDGDQDLIYTKHDYPTGEILTTLYIWENVNGQLINLQNSITQNYFLSFPGRMELGDFNNDGLKDIYVATFGNELTASYNLTARDEILINKGNFEFERVPNDYFPKSWSHGSTVGDINNDGFQDIFVTGMVGNPSYYLLNQNNRWTVVDTDYTGADPVDRDGIEDSSISDLNLDGYNDLIIGGRAQNYGSSVDDLLLFPARVYWGGPSGLTESYTDLPAPAQIAPWDITSFGSASGDLNGDGLHDIVMAVTNDGSKIIGDRFYPEWELRDLGLMTQEVATVNGLQILLNNGDQTFRDASSLIIDHPNRGVDTFFDIKLYDFNQDGHLDIYGGSLTYQEGDAPFIFLNDGKGNFKGLDIEGLDRKIWGFTVIDFNSDGFPDLASIGRTDFAADGSFRNTIEVALNSSVRSDNKYYGSAHDDFFIMPYASYYSANSGNDEVIGSSGNDTVVGGFGNDTVDGAEGIDTLVFNWAMSNYTINLTGNLLGTIRSAQEGRDTFVNVERLEFTDTSLALDTDGVAGQAYRIYKAAFDRAPDLPGLGYWIAAMDNGAALTGVAGGFIASAEFQSRYGAVSDTDFIRLLYENVLDRQPDAGGYAFWQDAMGRGLTREGLLAEFSESKENKANVEGLIAGGIEYTPFIS